MPTRKKLSHSKLRRRKGALERLLATYKGERRTLPTHVRDEIEVPQHRVKRG